MEKKVLAFGEVLWDIIENNPHIGGAPLNFAAHIRNCGMQADILTAVGNDALGNDAINFITELGMNDSLIQVVKEDTGWVEVEIKDGQPSYLIHENVAYDNIRLELFGKVNFSEYRYFYFGTLAQRTTVSKESLYMILENHTFEHVFFDINLRQDFYSKSIIQKSLSHTTIFKINDDEVPIVSNIFFGKKLSLDEFVGRICDSFNQIEIIIITAGEKGSYIFEKTAKYFVPAVSVEVKNTVGAGDAFSAAFFSSYLIERNAEKAGKIANLIGGFVASSEGAIPNYPNKLKKVFV